MLLFRKPNALQEPLTVHVFVFDENLPAKYNQNFTFLLNIPLHIKKRVEERLIIKIKSSYGKSINNNKQPILSQKDLLLINLNIMT